VICPIWQEWHTVQIFFKKWKKRKNKGLVWFGVRLLAFISPTLHFATPHHPYATPFLFISIFFYFSCFCHFSSLQNLHFSITVGTCFAITGFFHTFFKLLQLVHFSTLSSLLSQVVLCFMLSSYVCYTCLLVIQIST